MTIEQLKETIQRVKNKKVEIETEKKMLQKQRDELMAEIEKEGIKPENLKVEVDRLEKEISQALGSIEIPEI